MPRFIHVVGQVGSGKSTLILALARYWEKAGKHCAGQDPETLRKRSDALAQQPGADIYFLEHFPGDNFEVEMGDQVITVTNLAKQSSARSHQEVADRLCKLHAHADWMIPARSMLKDRERESLQADCGALGHVFTLDLLAFSKRRCCAVCGLAEPKATGQQKG